MLDEYLSADALPATSWLFAYFLLILPTALCLAPKPQSGVECSFHAYRLAQFDLQSTPYGSRSHQMSFEATALGGRNTLRRCMLVDWRELAGAAAAAGLSKAIDSSLAAIVVVLPGDMDALTDTDVQTLAELERQLLADSLEQAVYVARSTPGLSEVVHSLQQSTRAEKSSALAALMDAVTANAFQVIALPPSPAPVIAHPLYNIVGRLSASFGAISTDAPVIALVANYDSYGAAPAMAPSADSNGSGVAALLELMRLFTQLYSSSKTAPNIDLVFVFSAGGMVNYQGARQWIDDFWESIDDSGSTSAAGRRLHFAACLDALAGAPKLHMHVSKAPSNAESPIAKFHAILNAVVTSYSPNASSVPLVAKKINLAERQLAWEHERFSIRRLPAFTLSRLADPRDPVRRSLADTKSRTSVAALTHNVALIAEALHRYLYGVRVGAANGKHPTVFFDPTVGGEQVRAELLDGWLSGLTTRGRPAAHAAVVGPAGDNIVRDLKHAVDELSAHSSLVKVNVDAREPEFVLYPVTEAEIRIYGVKPAVFDLFLALLIAAHLGAVYFAVLNANAVLSFIESRLTLRQKVC